MYHLPRLCRLESSSGAEPWKSFLSDQRKTLLPALLISSNIFWALSSRLSLDAAEIRCRRCIVYDSMLKTSFMILLIVLGQKSRSFASLRMFRQGFRDTILCTVSTSFLVQTCLVLPGMGFVDTVPVPLRHFIRLLTVFMATPSCFGTLRTLWPACIGAAIWALFVISAVAHQQPRRN